MSAMNTPLASLERPDLSKIEQRAPSVAHLFRSRVAATPHAEAFRYPRGSGWESVTWQQVGERVQNIAAGLIALGIAPEDRVALASSTRYEWVLVDFAVMCAGAATTTVYPTTNATDVAYIVANSGSRVVVAENQAQVDKLLEHRSALPAVANVVIIDGDGDGDWVLTLDELERRGRQLLARSPDVVDARIAEVGPNRLASLIYTSGTTGRPKGVRLTHEAWTYTAAAIDALNVLGPEDLNFLWLPLAHSFGKVMLAQMVLTCRPPSGAMPAGNAIWKSCAITGALPASIATSAALAICGAATAGAAVWLGGAAAAAEGLSGQQGMVCVVSWA